MGFCFCFHVYGFVPWHSKKQMNSKPGASEGKMTVFNFNICRWSKSVPLNNCFTISSEKDWQTFNCSGSELPITLLEHEKCLEVFYKL